SKTCSCCGQVKESLSLSERIFHCDCGFVADRDWNASINIKREGLRLLALA
ncbi:zinc ribbon domain-containing protein, partial [Bacillus smithii]